MSSLFTTKRTIRRSSHRPAVVLLSFVLAVVFALMSFLSIAATPRQIPALSDTLPLNREILASSAIVYDASLLATKAVMERTFDASAEAQCDVTLSNDDDLIAQFSCTIPEADVTAALQATITVHGVESGNDWTMTTPLGDGLLTEITDGIFAGTLVLDGLDGSRFASSFCTGTKPLVPGEDIVVSIEIGSSGSDTAFVSASAMTNSLFAFDPEFDPQSENAAPTLKDQNGRYIARIACARHLQNLDTTTSGLTSATLFSCFQAAEISAVQLEDIDLSAYTSRSTTVFTPITNDAVTDYDGQDHIIHGLTVRTKDADAGLFSTFSGSIRSLAVTAASVTSDASAAGILAGRTTGETTVTDCAVIDAKVSAGGTAAGGLIGSVEAPIDVSGCKVYLEDLSGAEELLVIGCVTASNMAGGLIGASAKDAPVTIQDSFAATVIRAAGKIGTVGGLVGSTDAALVVSGSYADCYLHGSVIGGLAGRCGTDSAFDTCYSAGFALDATKDTVAAGFVPSAADVTNSYSAFCFDDPSATSTTNFTAYAVVRSGVARNVYYYNNDSDRKILGLSDSIRRLTGSELASAASMGLLHGFVTGGRCVPYALTDLIEADASYPFPSLPGLTHYNDWFMAVEPESAPAAHSAFVPKADSSVKPSSADSTDPAPQPNEMPASTTEPELYARIYEIRETMSSGEIILHRTLVFEFGGPTDNYGELLRLHSSLCEWSGTTEGGFLTDAAALCWGDALADSGIERIVFSADVQPKSTADWFADCSSLTDIENIDRLDTSAVTSMHGMFRGCRALTVLDISPLDTSSVADTSRMFADCESLVTIYAVETFASAENSIDMFAGCENLVGGNGTTYDESLVDQSYARLDKDGSLGYFTSPAAAAENRPDLLVNAEPALDLDTDRGEEGTVLREIGDMSGVMTASSEPNEDASADLLLTEQDQQDTAPAICSEGGASADAFSDASVYSLPDTEEAVKKVANECAAEIITHSDDATASVFISDESSSDASPTSDIDDNTIRSTSDNSPTATVEAASEDTPCAVSAADGETEPVPTILDGLVFDCSTESASAD